MAKRNYEGENIVIIAGPTFGQAMKFMIFGAAIGAGAVYYLNQKNAPVIKDHSVAETVGESAESLARRVTNLAGRAKTMASRAKGLMQTAQENFKPALEEIVAEGKKAAAEFEAKVKKDVEAAKEKSAEKMEDV